MDDLSPAVSHSAASWVRLSRSKELLRSLHVLLGEPEPRPEHVDKARQTLVDLLGEGSPRDAEADEVRCSLYTTESLSGEAVGTALAFVAFKLGRERIAETPMTAAEREARDASRRASRKKNRDRYKDGGMLVFSAASELEGLRKAPGTCLAFWPARETHYDLCWRLSGDASPPAALLDLLLACLKEVQASIFTVLRDTDSSALPPAIAFHPLVFRVCQRCFGAEEPPATPPETWEDLSGAPAHRQLVWLRWLVEDARANLVTP